MATPFIGEIRMFGGNFAPQGWAFCNGQLLPISNNTALFSLLGTIYGGDGVRTFALPDLQGRVPIHQTGVPPYVIGEFGGEENHALTTGEMPAHSHAFVSASAPTLDSPAGAVLGSPASGVALYAPVPPTGTMNPAGNAQIGGGVGHPNLMPYLCASFIIAMQGIYPSRN